MPHLFDPLTLRSVTLRNRIGVSPMCQYSSENGYPNDWHFVHLGSRAVGGAGLVITEATAVEPRGRISAWDAGLWEDAQIERWARIAKVVESHGAVAGMQIAHAGRKASVRRPWEGGKALPREVGGWEVIGPDDRPFADGYPKPRAMKREDMNVVRDAFVATARRAVAAGFRVIELHAAHGYLLNEFLSPLSNARTDQFGGSSFANRARFPLEVIRAVRGAIPDRLPLFVRLSCSDWAEGGWTIDDSIELARTLRGEDVDVIDCSSGGTVPHAKIELGPGYQVPFAQAIKRAAGIATAAVGMINTPRLADEIVHAERADLVLIARQFLRDPYFPLHAAKELGMTDRLPPPVQYGRAF
jgi:2,4-dienoyl-CoA reductase-like NADH-dependent reductase (Old Yellow Enzyme family)